MGDFIEMAETLRRHNPAAIKHVGEPPVNPNHKEHVAAIPYEALPQILQDGNALQGPDGLFFFPEIKLDENEVPYTTNVPDTRPLSHFGYIIERQHIEMHHRMALESNPHKLQLISYCLLNDDQGRIATYRRLKYVGGEATLTDRLSAFYGGHFIHKDIVCVPAVEGGDDEVYDMPQTFVNHFLRELNGEIRLMRVSDQAVVEITADMVDALGFLFAPNDTDPKDPGNYHLALVSRCRVDFDCELLQLIGSNPETEFTGWLRPEDIEEYLADNPTVEAWTRAILKNYNFLPELAAAEPDHEVKDDIEDLHDPELDSGESTGADPEQRSDLEPGEGQAEEQPRASLDDFPEGDAVAIPLDEVESGAVANNPRLKGLNVDYPNPEDQGAYDHADMRKPE